MPDYSISMRRADEREDFQDEAYRSTCEQIIASLEADYEQEFGAEYRAIHPFKPDGAKVHELAMRQLASEHDDE